MQRRATAATANRVFAAHKRASPVVRAVSRSPDARWDHLLVSAAAFFLVGVSGITVLLPAIAFLRLGILTVGASVVLLVMDRTVGRRMRWVMDPPAKALLVLLIWATITVPFALHNGMAFTAVKDMFSRSVLLAIVVLASVRGLRDLERLFLVHLVGVVLYASYSIAASSLNPVDARLHIEIGAYDPNDLAVFAVTAVPLAVYFMKAAYPVAIRLTAALGLCVSVFTVVQSGSRGGLLAFAATSLYVVFRYRSIPLRWRFGSVAAGVTLMLAIGNEGYWERMKTLLNVEEDYNVTDEVGRTQTWKRGVGYAFAHPFTGIGINNFGFAEVTISPRARMQRSAEGIQMLAPHNSFVQVLAELGIFGFGLFLFVIVGAFRSISGGRRVLERVDARAAPLADALTGMLVGLLVGVFFLSQGYSSMLHALLALALAYGKVARLTKRRHA